jgi:hypothetical protein
LLYAHYLGGFIIAVELLILLIFYKQLSFNKWIQMMLSFGLSLVLYIPGLLLFLKRFGTFSDKGTWVPEAQYTELYGNIIRFFNNTFTFFSIVGILIVFMLLFKKDLGWRIKGIFTQPKLRFFFLFFVLTYFGMFAFSKIVQPVFLDRYLLFTTIPLFLSLTILLGAVLSEQKQWWALIIIVPLAISTKWIPDNNREPDREAIYVSEKVNDKSLIAICPPFYDLTFLYHYDRELFCDYKHLHDNSEIQSIYSFEDIAFLSNFSNVVFIDANSQFTYPGNNIRTKLEGALLAESSKEFAGGIIIYNFVQR